MERFLEYLESATRRYDGVIHAYCLIDNHYQILLETHSGNLSRIMAHINGAYTTYFKISVRGRGTFFEGHIRLSLWKLINTLGG